MPISKNASMMRSEIALWPQPAHSVVLPPRYGCTSRPMRLIFLPGSGVVVVVVMVRICALEPATRLRPATAAAARRRLRCPSCTRIASVIERASIGRPL